MKKAGRARPCGQLDSWTGGRALAPHASGSVLRIAGPLAILVVPPRSFVERSTSGRGPFLDQMQVAGDSGDQPRAIVVVDADPPVGQARKMLGLERRVVRKQEHKATAVVGQQAKAGFLNDQDDTKGSSQDGRSFTSRAGAPTHRRGWSSKATPLVSRSCPLEPSTPTFAGRCHRRLAFGSDRRVGILKLPQFCIIRLTTRLVEHTMRAGSS